jgi:hypothetical protein
MAAQNAEGNANSADFVGESMNQHAFIQAATDKNGLGEEDWGDGGGQNSTVEGQQKAAATPAATPPAPGAASSPYVTPGAKDTRSAVLAILSSDNDCSEFFGASAASVFASVGIRLEDAPANVGAQTQEGKGADSVIFINKNGPFFNTSGIIGGKMQTLTVAPGYPGGFSSSKKLVMLHELGHVLSKLPEDHGNTPLSNQNSQTVMDHCSKELNQ